ncbi:MAG: LbtU family siderophore porin [Gammaproteobacteria bacterium]|nr:LbtU family siderophore porin [Gammaproteobacteria bacterium]
MKLKPIVTTLCIIGLMSATTVLAATSNAEQLKTIQAQINQLKMKINAMPAKSSTRVVNANSNVIGLNSTLSSQMMSNYYGNGREMNLLQARQNGSFANQSVILGGEAQADALHSHTNQDGYFASPIANSVSHHASSVGRLMLSNVRLSSAIALNNWSTAYIQAGSYNVGEGSTYLSGSSTNTVGSNNVNIQDAYLVLGNLAQSPMYGFVGKKDIDFGSFASVQPYSQPLTALYFSPTANTAGVGYTNYGLNLTGSVMNGGSANGIVAVNNISQRQNLDTQNANGINNYALNAAYNHNDNGVNWSMGAGYLNGSILTQPNGNSNGAWDVNAKASVNNFDLLAEYVSTVHTASSISGTTTSGTFFPNAIVTAMSLGGDYKFMTKGYNSVAALSYSKLGQGHSAGNAYQYAASYRVQPFSSNNVWTGLEYAHSKGLVNGFLFGSNTGTPNSYSGSTAKNNTVVLDITAFF